MTITLGISRQWGGGGRPRAGAAAGLAGLGRLGEGRRGRCRLARRYVFSTSWRGLRHLGLRGLMDPGMDLRTAATHTSGGWAAWRMILFMILRKSLRRRKGWGLHPRYSGFFSVVSK